MWRSEISFQSGDILRKEILEDLYRYPRDFVENYFWTYTDGILFGLEWVDSIDNEGNPVKGHHTITPGALKLNGNIYFLSEPIDVENVFAQQVKPDNKRILIFAEHGEKIRKENSRELYLLDLIAAEDSEAREIGNKGFYYSYVRYAYKEGFLPLSLEDRERVYGLYAANDGYGYAFSPTIMKAEVMPILNEKKDKHPLDYLLMEMVFHNEKLPLSFVKSYLMEYGRQEPNDESKTLPISNLKELPDEFAVAHSKKLLKEFMAACKKLYYGGRQADRGSDGNARPDVEKYRPIGGMI